MFNWLKSIFGAAKPSGPAVTMRRFQTADSTLSRDSITIAADAWVFDSKDGQTFRLFEIHDPQVEQCLVTYRAMMKSEGLAGRAYLEMWCRLPGGGEFFSKGLNQVVKGTTDWASYEIPFRLKKGQRPDLIKLNLVIEGRGRIWLRDVQVLKTPLSS
jgi:hypothetical protein